MGHALFGHRRGVAGCERRMIRDLVPYSRRLYFNDKRRERGLTAELVRYFEQYNNRKPDTGKRPITVYLLPTTRDKLLPKLVDGLGDIAARNRNVTDERLRGVEFVVQTDRRAAIEVVVSGIGGLAIISVDDLAG